MMTWDWVCKNCKSKKEAIVGQGHIKCDNCGFEETIKWHRPIYHGD